MEELLEELQLTDSLATSLGKFQKYLPDGFEGEDFAPFQSDKHEIANYILDRLVKEGFIYQAKFEFPEGYFGYLWLAKDIEILNDELLGCYKEDN